MNSGSYVLNATKGKKERVGRILQMHANKRSELDKVYSGDIAAAVGFRNTTTGDTICDEQHPVILESMEFPEPVIDIAIEPKTKASQDKMGEALVKLAEEDPTFRVRTDEETGQTIISGMGELHLDIIVDRLLREFNVEANVGAPQVAYKETFTKAVDVDSKYARQSADADSTDTVKYTSHLWIPTARRPSSLPLLLWAARFRRSISPQSARVSRKQPRPVCWADSLYWAYAQMCTTVPTTR